MATTGLPCSRAAAIYSITSWARPDWEMPMTMVLRSRGRLLYRVTTEGVARKAAMWFWIWNRYCP
jgi:hypothetical protein